MDTIYTAAGIALAAGFFFGYLLGGRHGYERREREVDDELADLRELAVQLRDGMRRVRADLIGGR